MEGISVHDIHDKKQRRNLLLVFSGFTLTIMLIEIFFRPQLFAFSGTLIIYLQQSFPSTGAQWFFKLISVLGTPSLLVPLFLITVASEAKKFLSIKMTIYICCVGYFVSILKSIYANPRPYWIYPNREDLPNYTSPGIIPFEKYAEYGNPSGHSFLVTSFYGYLYYVFLYKKPKNKPGIGAEEVSLSMTHGSPGVNQIELSEDNYTKDPDNSDKIPIHLKLPHQYPKEEVKESPLYPLSKFLYLTTCVLIGVSRMYLGMHSLNQVLLGLTLGSYFLYVIVYYIDPLLDDFLRKVKNKKIHGQPALIGLIMASYVVLSIIPILLYYKNEKMSGPELDDWWTVVKAEVNPPRWTFAYYKCFLDCGVVGIGFGLLFALTVTNNTYLDTAFKVGAITKLAILFRIIVFGLVVGVCAGLFVLIPTGENWILMYIINSNLAAFAGAYASIQFAPLAYIKFGLDADKYFFHSREHRFDHTFAI